MLYLRLVKSLSWLNVINTLFQRFFFASKGEPTGTGPAIWGKFREIWRLWTDGRLELKVLPDLWGATLLVFLSFLTIAWVLRIREFTSITRLLLSKTVIIWKIGLNLILDFIRESGLDLLLWHGKHLFRSGGSSSLAAMSLELDIKGLSIELIPLIFWVLFDLAKLGNCSKHFWITVFNCLALILVLHGHD